MAEKKKDKPSLRDILRPLFVLPFRPPINIPGTINESRRALATLRSAENQRFVFRGGSGSTRVTNISQPASGRSIRLATLPPELNFSNPKRPPKAPTTYLDFFGPRGVATSSLGVTRDLNTGAIRRLAASKLSDNARYQLLKFNLGTAMQDAVPGQFVGQGTTGSRRSLYTRGTGGAIGPGGRAQIRPDGTWQPRDAKGRLGTARPNPGSNLQQGLRSLASRNVVRPAMPVTRTFTNIHPAIQAYVNVDDIIRQMTGKGITERTVQGSSTQLERSLKKDPTINFSPLLPF